MTYIYATLDEPWFIDRFRDCGRQDQFSYNAKKALFEYYTELAEATGEPIEADIIAICCDWYESTADEVFEEYSNSIDIELIDQDKLHDEMMHFLEHETIAIDLGSSLLYLAF